MKQLVFVLIIGLIYGASLFVKDKQIQKQKMKETPTVFTIREKTGTPVNITKVLRKSFTNNVIVTGNNLGSKIYASVAPKIATQIKPGALASIRLNNESLYGSVVSVEKRANRLSGLHKIVVSFANQKLPTNLYVMNIQTSKTKNTLVVKRDAVSNRGGTDHVYIVNDDNTVQRRDIVTISDNKDYFAIKSGLKEGEKVVLSDQRYLKDGEKINIVESVLE